MQQPTFTSIRIRTPTDAHVIFFAVVRGMLPMVAHRLDIRERRYIQSGCVFVWEERGQLPAASGVRPSSMLPACAGSIDHLMWISPRSNAGRMEGGGALLGCET